MMASRYAHAKQFKRHQRQLRILRSRLGRIIRDIRRKIEGQDALEEAFALPLRRATQIRSQQQRQRGWKLYSFHAPEVECIGKGKAAAPYEFGVKATPPHRIIDIASGSTPRRRAPPESAPRCQGSGEKRRLGSAWPAGMPPTETAFRQ